jgi:hypothetical protein
VNTSPHSGRDRTTAWFVKMLLLMLLSQYMSLLVEEKGSSFSGVVLNIYM